MKKANESEERKRQFEEEAAEVLSKLFRIVYSRTHDADLAGDIAQEAACRFLNSMNERDWSRDIKSYEAFLTRIAINCLNNRWRSQVKKRFVSLDSDFDEKLHEEVNHALGLNGRSTSANDSELEKLHADVLLRLLDGLTDFDKHLFELRRVEDLSPKEIAERTGKDFYWVHYQLAKIEARLRYQARQYLKVSGKQSFF